jgi:hypothetical protein
MPITDLRYGALIIRQPEPGLLNPFLGKISMRCSFINAGKKAVKMKTGQTGLSGNMIQVYGFMEIFIQKMLGCQDLAIYV